MVDNVKMLRIGNVLATGIFGLLVSFEDVFFVLHLLGYSYLQTYTYIFYS